MTETKSKSRSVGPDILAPEVTIPEAAQRYWYFMGCKGDGCHDTQALHIAGMTFPRCHGVYRKIPGDPNTTSMVIRPGDRSALTIPMLERLVDHLPRRLVRVRNLGVETSQLPGVSVPETDANFSRVRKIVSVVKLWTDQQLKEFMDNFGIRRTNAPQPGDVPAATYLVLIRCKDKKIPSQVELADGTIREFDLEDDSTWPTIAETGVHIPDVNEIGDANTP